LKKQNSELNLNLTEEIKEKIKISRKLEGSRDTLQDSNHRKSSSKSKRKSTSIKPAIKFSIDLNKSNKSLSCKNSLMSMGLDKSLKSSQVDKRSLASRGGSYALFMGKKDKKTKQGSNECLKKPIWRRIW
jgi:hypothetical protein